MDKCDLLMVHLNAELDRRNGYTIAAGATIYLANKIMENEGRDQKEIRQMTTAAEAETSRRFSDPQGLR